MRAYAVMERWSALWCAAALAGCSIERVRFSENGTPLDARIADALGIKPRDASPDSAPDASPDSAPDAPTDAPPDAAPDAPPDAPPDAAPDAPPDAPPPPPLGSKDNPARSCTELKAIDAPSSVYWVKPSPASPFKVYCEQTLNGGGWALLENSVRKADGTTTAFWQFPYAQRLSELGSPDPAQNYYNGALYLVGTRYFDYIVDLQNTGALAAEMTATGIDATAMTFTQPAQVAGLATVYKNQFASGWSSPDFDGDIYAQGNCATLYTNVSQHYGQCWVYNLGSDAEPAKDYRDGGVGPHVHDAELVALKLSLQPNGEGYSQVNRIARFVRW